jgi:heme A synthase
MFMSVHLVNTFALLAFLSLTPWWLSGGAALRLRGRASTAGWLVAGAVAMVLAGVSGAVAALGDTLYPPGSLAEALSADLSAASHLLIRLRILHPAITITVATAFIASGLALRRSPVPRAARFGFAIAILAAAQIGAGFVNVLFLAPVWMQIVHLLIADALWICYVLLGASLLADREFVLSPTCS